MFMIIGFQRFIVLENNYLLLATDNCILLKYDYFKQTECNSYLKNVNYIKNQTVFFKIDTTINIIY